MEHVTVELRKAQNIGYVERVVRAVIAAGLILEVLLSGAGPLGGYALLPFLALYLGMSATLGWDPIYAWGNQQANSGKGMGTLPRPTFNSAC